MSELLLPYPGPRWHTHTHTRAHAECLFSCLESESSLASPWVQALSCNPGMLPEEHQTTATGIDASDEMVGLGNSNVLTSSTRFVVSLIRGVYEAERSRPSTLWHQFSDTGGPPTFTMGAVDFL